MERIVGGGVETERRGRRLAIRVLGPVRVTRDGEALALPRSRKVRALLAFLALGSGPFTRSRLCDLLWDAPNDPRGELRWCLSKLRGVLDDDDRRRVVTTGDRIELDLSDCSVDALDVDRIAKEGLDALSTDALGELASAFDGDLLDGLQIDGNPELTGWLSAQRQRYRALRVEVFAALAMRSPPGSDEMFRRLERWLELGPFDPRAHERMIETLVKLGRVRDAEAHVAAAIKSFEEEGLDWSPVRERWNALRERTPRVEVVAAPEAPPRARRRASVAVMPFADRSQTGSREAPRTPWASAASARRKPDGC